MPRWRMTSIGGDRSVVDLNTFGKGQDAQRVHRGGSWINTARNCRSAIRTRNHPGNRNRNRGFRLCLSSGTARLCLHRTSPFPIPQLNRAGTHPRASARRLPISQPGWERRRESTGKQPSFSSCCVCHPHHLHLVRCPGMCSGRGSRMKWLSERCRRGVFAGGLVASIQMRSRGSGSK